MLRECSEHGYFRGDTCPDCNSSGKFLMNADELDRLGRIIAGVLRHFPERFNLNMDDNGYVDLIALIDAIRKRRPQFHWLRQHHLYAIADTDPKGRYQVDDDYIRATYGHSLDIDPDFPTDDIPDFLFYPTTQEEANILLETGLKPSDRKKVHLSKTSRDAYIAGRHRVDDPIILEVDAKSAIESGIVIKHAGITVYLARDVPETFVSRLNDEEMNRLREDDYGDDIKAALPSPDQVAEPPSDNLDEPESE